MRFAQAIKHLRANPADAFYYWQGTGRYWLYRHYPHLLPAWMIRQVEARKLAAQACYRNGSCFCCGCETPSVFWAGKGCKKGTPNAPLHCQSGEPCYGPLKNPSSLFRLFTWIKSAASRKH